MALIYVTGGAKSGKSEFSEDLLLKMNNGRQNNIYLATSVVFDEEMKIKVDIHKERRKDKWLTIEAYKDFYEKLEPTFLEKSIKNNMLVDCLTNMVSNIIFEKRDVDWNNPTKKDLEKCDELVKKHVQELINIVDKFENVIIVSNEIGMGIVPEYPLGRYFREIAGKMNKLIANIANEVYFVVSGIPMKIKK